MANALMEQYLPAGMTRDKYASMKQDKFYSDIQGQAKQANALAAQVDPATWGRTAQMAYKKHMQESGGQAQDPATWMTQNANYF